MSGLSELIARTDAVGLAVALALLGMSVTAWVLIFWKAWVLRRASADIARAIPVFWDAPDTDTGRQRLQALDREQLLLPLLQATLATPAGQTLQAQAQPASQLTRRLRDALHAGLAHLQRGQTVLASVGSTAPFVGLFGTVWGIYHALLALGEGAGFTLDKVAAPVGEALVMTAAGLAVAIPAVLAYNLFGRWVAQAEAELEGFAHDLREWRLDTELAPSPSPSSAAPRPRAAGDRD
jgi:biopolymer transport protein ExbB